jgi:hypothetical protein
MKRPAAAELATCEIVGISLIVRNGVNKFQVYNKGTYIGIFDDCNEAAKALAQAKGVRVQKLDRHRVGNDNDDDDTDDEVIIYNHIYKTGQVYEARANGEYLGRFPSQHVAAQEVVLHLGISFAQSFVH